MKDKGKLLSMRVGEEGSWRGEERGRAALSFQRRKRHHQNAVGVMSWAVYLTPPHNPKSSVNMFTHKTFGVSGVTVETSIGHQPGGDV